VLSSLPGVPRVGSPASSVLKALRLPAALPASLGFLRFAVPSLRLGSLPRCKAQRPQARACLPDSQNRLSDGDDRISQVPGGPHYVRALLFDPGGTSALGHYCASALSSTFVTVSTPAISPISGLNPTARTLAVYASQRGLLHRHARLASGWLAIPFRADFYICWAPTKGFRVTSSVPSSFPKLSWRTTKLGTVRAVAR
jgi:hypothetical protein